MSSVSASRTVVASPSTTVTAACVEAGAANSEAVGCVSELVAMPDEGEVAGFGHLRVDGRRLPARWLFTHQ